MSSSSFEKHTHPGYYAAIISSIAIVFAIDLMTVVGVATWMLYLIPLSLCMFIWRPVVPIVVATASTVLMVADYFLSAPGESVTTLWVAQTNRAIGVFVTWVVAIQAWQIINTRVNLRRREWMRTAQTGLAQRVIGDHSVEWLGENIVEYLATYLGAQVGALYKRNGPDGHLARVGGTGLAPETANQRVSFKVGEGIIGRVAQHGKALQITDLPDDYLKIASGLGERRPTALIAAPLRAYGEVNGVIELGFLRPVGQAELDLLEQLSEQIGVALRTARLRTEREKLLAETQRQSQELQKQQEELRVANEELEEQSNALRESQARLENQQAELEQTNVQLEEHAEMLARQNDALEAAKRSLDLKTQELARANQYKSEFLANMSHELRTPLNSCLILAKLLADNRTGNLTEEQVRFARSIYSSGSDLLELINDILDLSKIEARKVEVKPEDVEVAPIVESLTQTFRPLADEKHLKFITEVASSTPAIIHTDSQRLRQILKNLLSNAIKFTEEGEVALLVSSAESGSVRFTVRDTGIGIAPHQQEVIFEPFRQADGTTNRRFGGTGLGLSISRELAHLLGGRIELESTPGEGSTFHLIIPRQLMVAHQPQQPTQVSVVTEPAPSQPVQRKAAESAANRRPPAMPDDRDRIVNPQRVLLVVEDDLVFAKVLYDLAQEKGFHCLVAVTADEGIELARQYRPSAIILDIKLPDHTGLSVLDRLKHDSSTRHIPVQVVSAEDYSQAALRMGAAGALLKPVGREELAEAIERLEKRFMQAVRSVLIVEDDALQRESLSQLLSSETVRTVLVDTAAAALEQLQQTTFDCMVLDLALPDASGYELLERMASEEKYAFPPVIVYTGRSLSTEEEQRLRRYSSSIIIKGAKSPERLLDEVTLFLHQVEGTLPPDRQRMLREARSRNQAFEGRRILIVEDDVRNIFALSSVLEPQGAKLAIARNGREAIDTLLRDRDIDIVLMDIMMPEMDGLTAMREIRKTPQIADVPIIALTAKAMPDDQQRCIDAGANDYISKPIDIEKLLSLIRIWLPR